MLLCLMQSYGNQTTKFQPILYQIQLLIQSSTYSGRRLELWVWRTAKKFSSRLELPVEVAGPATQFEWRMLVEVMMTPGSNRRWMGSVTSGSAKHDGTGDDGRDHDFVLFVEPNVV